MYYWCYWENLGAIIKLFQLDWIKQKLYDLKEIINCNYMLDICSRMLLRRTMGVFVHSRKKSSSYWGLFIGYLQHFQTHIIPRYKAPYEDEYFQPICWACMAASSKKCSYHQWALVKYNIFQFIWQSVLWIYHELTSSSWLIHPSEFPIYVFLFQLCSTLYLHLEMTRKSDLMHSWSLTYILKTCRIKKVSYFTTTSSRLAFP